MGISSEKKKRSDKRKQRSGKSERGRDKEAESENKTNRYSILLSGDGGVLSEFHFVAYPLSS